MECTHHGPYCNKPISYIEIGSSKKEWQIKEAGEIIANIIMEVLIGYKEENYRIALGIGGTHYCSNFNKIELNTDIAFAHICPKYQLERLDKEVLRQAIEKSKASFCLLDWKGLGKNKKKVKQLLEELNFPYERTDQL